MFTLYKELDPKPSFVHELGLGTYILTSAQNKAQCLSCSSSSQTHHLVWPISYLLLLAIITKSCYTIKVCLAGKHFADCVLISFYTTVQSRAGNYINNKSMKDPKIEEVSKMSFKASPHISFVNVGFCFVYAPIHWEICVSE